MIGIIGAMSEEVMAIKALMDNIEIKKINNLEFIVGTIDNKDVVLAKSGIGKTLSAMTTTVLVSNYPIKQVINVGSAGGLSPSLEVLDVIVSNRVAQADFDLTAFGYGRDFLEKRLSFQADKDLVDKLLALNLDKVIFGDIVSNDTFISKVEQRDALLSNFKSALCADMEAGSIAMVLDHFKIPFIVIRSISDVVGSDKDNALEFSEYLVHASKNSAKITKELIKVL